MFHSSHHKCSLADELYSLNQLIDAINSSSCPPREFHLYLRTIILKYIKPLLLQRFRLPHDTPLQHTKILSFLSRFITPEHLQKIFELTDNPTRQSGGRYFGAGSFGAVYGDPGLPCRDQPLPSTNGIVTKVFFKSGEAEREISSIKGVLDRLTSAEQDILRKFCVLPTEMEVCKLDCDAVLSNPDIYDKDTYGWSERSLCRSGSSSQMVKYPKAKASLRNVFTNETSTFFRYFRNLIDFSNIIEGIHFFEKCKILHGDIKPSNAVWIDDTFKLIDMADSKYIDTLQSVGHIPIAFQYLVYPPCSPWIEMCGFADDEVRNYPTRDDISHTVESIIDLYDSAKGFNSKFIVSKFNRIFEDPCDSPGMSNLSEADQQHIRHQLAYLHAQKLYLKTKGRSQTDILKDINKYSKKLKHSDNPVWYGTMCYITTDDFSEINTHNERVLHHYDTFGIIKAKYDLLMRVDTYACGISLLICTQLFLQQTEEAITTKQAELIAQVFDFIFLCCDADRYTTPKRKNLVEQWRSILASYVANEDSEMDDSDMDDSEL